MRTHWSTAFGSDCVCMFRRQSAFAPGARGLVRSVPAPWSWQVASADACAWRRAMCGRKDGGHAGWGWAGWGPAQSPPLSDAACVERVHVGVCTLPHACARMLAHVRRPRRASAQEGDTPNKNRRSSEVPPPVFSCVFPRKGGAVQLFTYSTLSQDIVRCAPLQRHAMSP